jgi:4-hydroxy-tetrahydrodipicolinate reductase
MKIAVVGYGQTGTRIAELASRAGHEIVVIDPKTPATSLSQYPSYSEISTDSLAGVDVAIDFTSPNTAIENIRLLASLGTSMVMGTTGWYSQIDEVKNVVKQTGIGFIYAQNFSIGVALYLTVLKQAARLFATAENYDVASIEYHHNLKQDSPSGTALAVANTLLENIPRKTALVTDKLDRRPEPHELHLASLRCGHIPGSHSVLFDSAQDTITITHEARNRDGFAAGAVKAAELLKGKTGFFSFDELLGG